MSDASRLGYLRPFKNLSYYVHINKGKYLKTMEHFKLRCLYVVDINDSMPSCQLNSAAWHSDVVYLASTYFRNFSDKRKGQ
jgi:hypothetical protein